MQRWQCLIYKGTLETLSDQICGRYHRFSDLKSVYFCDFFHCFLKERNVRVTFAEKQQVQINSLKKQKNCYLIRTISYKAFKELTTVIIRALSKLLKLPKQLKVCNCNQFINLLILPKGTEK